MIPKELYIDQFNFKPLFPEDGIEVFICDYYNNTVKEIVFTQWNANFITFIHEGNSGNWSYYSNVYKSFHFSFIKVWDVLYKKYNLNPKKVNEFCIPALERHFKFKIDVIYDDDLPF